MTWTVADAGEADLPAILAIYNDAIANTTAVYTDALSTLGGIDAANEASLALHRELGFTPAAHLHQVARKFGAWVDLVLVEKQLS
jgi:L-amino acid N-acyltransferase YncA